MSLHRQERPLPQNMPALERYTKNIVIAFDWMLP